jgi:hypothetical protein
MGMWNTCHWTTWIELQANHQCITWGRINWSYGNMRRFLLSNAPKILIFAIASLIASSNLQAQVDTLEIIVDSANATAGASLSALGYDPITKTVYTSSFGSGGSLRKTVLNSDGSQTSSQIATATQLQLYYRDGDTTRSVSNPTQSGIVLNPYAIGSVPAYSFALITDGATTAFPAPASGTDPSATKRVYSYNLQSIPSGGDGRDIFTTRVTLANMAALSGNPASTSSTTGRQGAFSGNGQSFYFIDTSTAYGGIYKVPALGGSLTKLLSTSDEINTEPAVLTSGGIDTIYFRGGGSTGNVGGIDKITVDLTTGVATGRAIAFSATAINDFLELPASTVTNFSMTSDADGNLYFNSTNSSPDRRGIYKIDSQGRFSKVVSHAERISEFGGSPNPNTLRLQPRTTSYTGPLGTFDITQLLYTELPTNRVAGANVFKAGDFNRDNILSSLDIDLFKSENVLTTRGVAMTTILGFTASDYKFDMNGNSVTDWKDIKIMQMFFDFGNGDIDLNGIVDFADFQVLQNNYGTTAKTWFSGDLDGNDVVDFADFQLFQNSLGYQSSVLTGATAMAFDQTAFNAFVSTIPEPSTYVALGGITLIGLMVRRRTNRPCDCTGVAA